MVSKCLVNRSEGGLYGVIDQWDVRSKITQAHALGNNFNRDIHNNILKSSFIILRNTLPQSAI